MSHGRSGIGIAFLVALTGPAVAQPVSPMSGSAMPFAPDPVPAPGASPSSSRAPSSSVPPSMPNGSSPSTMPGGSPPAPPRAGFAEEYAPLRELSTAGLPEITPPPDKYAHRERDTPDHLTPFAPNHGGWYTDGEFLLMRARNTDMDYAIRGSNVGLGTVGPINTLKYTLGAGLRTEFGYRFGTDGKWEAGFAYTYFGDHGGTTDAAGPNDVLFPTLTRPGLTDRALTASVNSNLNYQLFDLVVGRRMVVDANFALRWLGGFRFADIRQNFNADYNGDDARQDAVNTRSRFQGFGPVVGVEGVLGGWRGLHMYSRALVGLVSGTSSNSLIETNDSGATTYVNTSYDVRKVVPTGTLAIGGGWQYRTLSIRVGYQISYWDGIFERPRFVDDVSPGKIITRPSNLTLEGVFFQVGLSF